MNKTNKFNEHFIKTNDEETSKNYLKSGFRLLDYSNGTWVFLNDINLPLTFNNNKAVYTNMLTF